MLNGSALPLTGEPMSSMVIGYGLESMNHALKAIDEMGMSEEYQAWYGKVKDWETFIALGCLFPHRKWISGVQLF